MIVKDAEGNETLATRKPMRWVKLMTRILHTKKLIKRSKPAKLLFYQSLAIAGANGKGGELGDAEDISIDVHDDDIQGALDELVENELFSVDGDGVYTLVEFEVTQLDKESSTERVQRHRAERRADEEAEAAAKAALIAAATSTTTKNGTNVSETIQEPNGTADLDSDEEKTLTPFVDSASASSTGNGDMGFVLTPTSTPVAPPTRPTPSPALALGAGVPGAPPPAPASTRNPKVPPVPYEAILELFDRILAADIDRAPRGNQSSAAQRSRVSGVGRRWEDVFLSGGDMVPKTQADGLLWFEGFFEKLAEMDWYCGRDPNSNGWKADFDWLMLSPKNFEKILRKIRSGSKK